jgi:ketosteroid isomerase-like protein
MNRQTLSRVTAATLLGVAVLVGGGKSYASDADDVKATIDEFHAALTARDIDKMDAVWVHDASVMDKEPVDKAVTLGWEGTRKSFQGLFGATAELMVAQAEGPHIQVQGDTAWAMHRVRGAKVEDGPSLRPSRLRGGRLQETERSLALRVARHLDPDAAAVGS